MSANRFLSWASAEIFYTLSVLVAVAFAILSSEISSALKLTASDLGLLSGVFFFTYAAGQLVLGILISRVSARLVLGFTGLLSAASTFLFSISEGFTSALIAWGMMGIGLSSTFVGVIYLLGRDYGKNFAFMSSLSQSLTNLFAAALAVISAFFPILVDFRRPFQVLTAMLIVSAVLVFLLVGGEVAATTTKTKPSLSQAFRVSIANKRFWAALVFYCGTFGTLLAFTNLWDIQFQMNFFSHTVQQSAVMNSMIPLGMTVGGLVAGAWAVKSGFALPARVFVLAVLVCFIIQLIVPLSAVATGALMFIAGCGFASSTLGLAALQENLPSYAAPPATSLTVTAAFIFGGLVQPLVGAAIGGPHRASELLDLVQSSNPDFGTYQRGLAWLVGSIACAAAASFFLGPSGSRAGNPGQS